MKKNNWLKVLDVGIILLFIFAVGYTIWIITTDPYIFCVTTRGKVDIEDNGTHCFKTINESLEFQNYISEKYYDELHTESGFDPSFIE